MRRGFTSLVQVPLLVLTSSLVMQVPLSAQHVGSAGLVGSGHIGDQCTPGLPHVLRTIPKHHSRSALAILTTWSAETWPGGAPPIQRGRQRQPGWEKQGTLPCGLRRLSLVVRSAMAFRWDTACLMPAMLTILRPPRATATG